MAMQFSDSANGTGIIELIEDLTNTPSTTTDSYPLKKKTRDVNNAYARFMMLAISASGKWQIDDTNQTGHPILISNLVANQQDYNYTVDGESTPNQILDLYRVEVKDSSGNWSQILPFDQSDLQGTSLTNFMATAGIPQYYDKVGNALFLYPKPSANVTGGLKLWFARTPAYFVSTDTTKKAGIPDIFHEYLALRPSWQYCARKKQSALAKDYKMQVLEIEDSIEVYYSNRSREEKTQITMSYRDPR
jgi:hypothetical protein